MTMPKFCLQTLCQLVQEKNFFQLSLEYNPPRRSVIFFDSGIGGLSILRDFYLRQPHVHFQQSFDIYYQADSEYFPYGDLPISKIIERTIFCIDTLQHLHPDLFVLACNTATTHAIQTLRKKYPLIPFVGVEPYVKFPHKQNYKKIILLVTPGTYQSPRLHELHLKYNQDGQVQIMPMQNLARIITQEFQEYQDKKSNDEDLKKELAPIINLKPDLVLLGCTHYSLIEEKLHLLLGVPCISPNQAIVQRIFDLLGISK